MRCLRTNFLQYGKEFLRNQTTKPSQAQNSQKPGLFDTPWKLYGDSYIFVMKPPKLYTGPEKALHEQLANPRLNLYSYVIFVDYSNSPAGPYRELVYIPGTFDFKGRQLPSVTRIYVSKQESLDAGRKIWGFPKYLADFDVQKDKDGVDRISMTVNGKPAVNLAFKPQSWSMPVTTSLMPKRMRTIGQILDGKTAIVSPWATGKAHYAKPLEAWSEPEHFPSLSLENMVIAVKLRNAEAVFPAPEIL